MLWNRLTSTLLLHMFDARLNLILRDAQHLSNTMRRSRRIKCLATADENVHCDRNFSPKGKAGRKRWDHGRRRGRLQDRYLSLRSYRDAKDGDPEIGR